MRLSVLVICHDMRREAARTLRSLSALVQRDLVSEDYEVIAIDNGSREPLDPAAVAAEGPRFRYRYLETVSASPVEAVNAGADMADGDLLAVIVDGARMATPGLVGQTQRAAALYPEPFVVAPAFHLGPDVQNRSILEGYDRAAEDRLLEGVGWPADGYRLFEIAVLAQSSASGFLGGVPPECSWFAMRRDSFLALGGFDPRFRSPGGGLANHDFRDRALSLPGIAPVVLLGEGVFHQVHGGVATGAPPGDHPFERFQEEYAAIHGRRYAPAPAPDPVYFGRLPAAARRFLGPG